MTLEQTFVDAWQKRGLLSTLLLPLSWLFGGITALRRLAFRRGWLSSEAVDIPVCVVGNITVGGVGKTPLVVELVERLQALGEMPAVVSRGYGAVIGDQPVLVASHHSAVAVGDEPLLIQSRTGCIVAVHPDRVAAARAAQAAGASCIVADDGLQHYRLRRDAEIVVMDGDRGTGNGRLLPAGPLREPVSRLRSVDLQVVRGGAALGPTLQRQPVSMRLEPGSLQPLLGASGNTGAAKTLADFSGESVHAVAAIGHPERFFETLRKAGLQVQTHAYSDHHAFVPTDFAAFAGKTIIMTEKDAVKCREFAQSTWWSLPVSAMFSASDSAQVDTLIRDLLNSKKP